VSRAQRSTPVEPATVLTNWRGALLTRDPG